MAILDDTRDDWNARPPLRTRTSVPWGDRIGVSWHWIGPGKGPSAAGPHSACLAQVRDWQWQHQHKPAPDGPWKDIGYNVLICQHARAIEGRGLTYSGSHSPGVNYAHVGVQFMVGTDTPGGVNPGMLARAVRLRADIGALGKNIRRDWGHRDDPKASTECPGNELYRWVHSGGPTTAPAKPQTAAPQEDDMPTPAEVFKADVIAAPAPSDTNPTWSAETYLRAIYRNAQAASRDAAAALAIAKAQAEAGRALTADEITAAVRAALEVEATVVVKAVEK